MLARALLRLTVPFVTTMSSVVKLVTGSQKGRMLWICRKLVTAPALSDRQS
jgi:hypothetical protein